MPGRLGRMEGRRAGPAPVSRRPAGPGGAGGARSRAGQAAGTGRPGGGWAARPSAPRSRRTAWARSPRPRCVAGRRSGNRREASITTRAERAVDKWPLRWSGIALTGARLCGHGWASRPVCGRRNWPFVRRPGGWTGRGTWLVSQRASGARLASGHGVEPRGNSSVQRRSNPVGATTVLTRVSTASTVPWADRINVDRQPEDRDDVAVPAALPWPERGGRCLERGSVVGD